MNRKKLRKLVKTPVRFARDAVSNRLLAAKTALLKPRSRRRYTVVAAVYGVEAYLDDFFRSLVSQTIDFETRLEIIVVDDGSQDRSGAIAAAWQARYPRSIRYIRKENGGQASARNVGLEHATGDWVTFIDPDDFVDEEYFEQIDALLDRADAREVTLVSCNFIYYDEKTKSARDTHPLRSRFKKGCRIVRLSNLTTDIQLSAATAVFRRDLLRKTELRFDERIRPSFEDAHFTNRYLLAAGGHDIAFASKAKYYYRKRADESSSLDRAWSNSSLFDAVLDLGCRDLFRRAAAQSESGEIPVWLQRVVLYHLIWYFKKVVNNQESVAFLDDEARLRFESLVRELMSKIDVSTIMRFNLAGTWLYHKTGLLGLFKEAAPEFQHVYVEDHDRVQGLVQLRYFYWSEPGLELFSADGREIFPVFAKVRRHDFLGQTFVHERIVWVPLSDPSERLRAAIGKVETRLVVRGQFHKDGLTLRDVARLHRKPESKKLPLNRRIVARVGSSAPAKLLYGDAFVFMDRDTQADDNAEHLYRYVLRHRPDINAFFVLRRSSHDWDRLARDGFRLIEFGSLQHRVVMMHAKHLISSQADQYVLNGAGDSRFTFLQHGVTKDDLSGWLNAKRIDCFVTASAAEHASIVQDHGPYKFSEREVVLSGFPRHDALGARARSPERLLVIMPTWRQSLAGQAIGLGHVRAQNPAFFESEYARTWKALLRAPALREMVEAHGYRVQFFPHPNIQPYLEWFEPPAYIETIAHRPDRSMQETFREAAIMLTDYSSTAFEMAFLRKAVLYFQFDRELVFGGGHTTKKGYYDYDRDGFGPVCLDEGSLLGALSGLLVSDGRPSLEHLARMDRTFAFRDGRSCQRTLEAILDLDAPVHPRDRSADLLVEAARSATRLGAWERAEHRWARVLEGSASARPADAELRLIEAKRRVGKVDEAEQLLTVLEARRGVDDAMLCERAEISSAAQDWPRAVVLWGKRARARTDPAKQAHAVVRLAEAHRRSGAFEHARRALDSLQSDAEPSEAAVERAELASSWGRWSEALVRWNALSSRSVPPEQTQLRLGEALAELAHHDRALACIDAYLDTADPRHEREARALRLELTTELRDRAAVDPVGFHPLPMVLESRTAETSDAPVILVPLSRGGSS